MPNYTSGRYLFEKYPILNKLEDEKKDVEMEIVLKKIEGQGILRFLRRVEREAEAVANNLVMPSMEEDDHDEMNDCLVELKAYVGMSRIDVNKQSFISSFAFCE